MELGVWLTFVKTLEFPPLCMVLIYRVVFLNAFAYAIAGCLKFDGPNVYKLLASFANSLFCSLYLY
jgi:hypothetical protein